MVLYMALKNISEKLSPGALLTIEGIDGSGKTTVARALSAYFSHYISVVLTREPGATLLGKHIRSILHERTFSLNSLSEFFLFAADRADHVTSIIKPALFNGSLVISDRMADSSLAYQGYGRGLDVEMITSVNNWILDGIKPDLTLYIRIDYATAFERMLARAEKLTSFEQEKELFFGRVIEGFDTIFNQRANVIVIDGAQTQEQVVKQSIDHISAWLINRYGLQL